MTQYWLFKSEPDCYSFADLVADGETSWDGVRNYQARNYLRDKVKRGDQVLFYHSGTEAPAIVGIAEVIGEAEPDPTQFDPAADHPDPRSDPANPTWVQVRIRPVAAIEPPLTLKALRARIELDGMVLLQKGSRLSIQPVSRHEWRTILSLAGVETLARRPRPK